MLTAYANEIGDEYLLYPEEERTADIQLTPVVNYLLMTVWVVICLIGFAVIFIGKLPVAGTMIIAVPTFVGMILKPSFALCIFALVLPTSVGVGIEGVFTIGRGVGIALAFAFALNLLISRPSLNMRNKALWLIMLWTLWIFFVSALSHYPRQELRRAFSQFQLMLMVFITYWILETNREKAIVWVLRSYIVGTLGTIIITFITGAAMRSMTDIEEQERYGATLGRMIDQNQMAALISLAFLAAIYLLVRDRNLFWRIIHIIAILFLPIMVIRTGSRGALVALTFTLLSPLLFIRQIWRKPALVILLLIAIILASGASALFVQVGGLTKRVQERIVDTQAMRTAFDYRMSLNMAATRVAFTRVIGSGGIAWFEVSGMRHYPHSDLFRALGYYGVPGAALFVSIVVIMVLTIRRIPLTVEKLYARAALTFLIVMGLGLGQLEMKYFWLFIATVMAFERLAWVYRSPVEELPDNIHTQPNE